MVAEIDGLPESKIHARGKPAEFAADLGEQRAHQQAVAGSSLEIFRLCETVVEVNGVVVAADLGEGDGILFGETTRDCEHVARGEAGDRFLRMADIEGYARA